MRKTFFSFGIVAVLFIAIGLAWSGAFAACDVSPDGTTFNLQGCNPLAGKGVNTILDVVCLVAQFLATKLMPPIAMLMVLWSSFLYLTAAGKPQNVTSAKQILVFTIIGAGILVLAPALIALVLTIFGSGQTAGTCSQLATTSTFTTVLANLINWFSWFLAVSSVAAGLYSGFLYMTSGGDPRNTAIAGKTLFYAVIGIVVAILSFSIISLIKSFIVP